jgi:TP901 family phage tail tape measure protein
MGPNDVYVNLVANISEYAAPMETASTQAETMGAQLEAVSAQVDAATAAMGAGTDEAATAMDAAFREMVANAAAAGDALKAVGASADEAAGQTDAAAEAMSIATARMEASQESAYAQMMLSNDALRASLAKNVAAFQAQADEAEAANARLDESMTSTGVFAGASGQALGKAFMVAGVAAGAIGAISVDMAAKFQQSTTRLVTSGGELQANLNADRQAILDLAGQVGYSAEALSTALYTATSAGYQGAQGMTVLTAAAQGAKTENADLGTVVNGLTDILTDYHLKATDSATVMSQLVETTSQGKTSFQDLSSSLSTVVPLAASANINIQDLLGTLAQMTAHGVSAQEATQQMANAIREFESPSQTMTAELGQIGLNANTLSQQLGTKGLAGTLQEVEQAVLQHMGPAGTVLLSSFNTSQVAAQKAQDAFQGLSKQAQAIANEYSSGKMTGGFKQWSAAVSSLSAPQANLLNQWKTLQNQSAGFSNALKSGGGDVQSFDQAMQRATGTSSALQVALLTTGENTQSVNDKIRAIGGATAQADGSVRGWSDIQGTLNQKLSEAKDGLGALAIAIGEKVLPPLTKVVGGFANFVNWLTAHKAAMDALIAVLGVMLVGALGAAAVAVWGFTTALLANPITWVAALVVGLGVAVYELISHWSSVTHFFEGIWNAVSHAFETGIHAVMGFLKNWGPEILAVIMPVIGIPLLIVQHWGQISHFFEGLWHDVTSAVSTGVGAVVHFFEGIPGDIRKALDAVGSAVSDGFSAVLDFFKNLPHELGYALGYMAGLVVRGAIVVGESLYHGITTGAVAVVSFFEQLPSRVVGFLANASHWLDEKGHEILVGLWHGITIEWDNLVKWFKDLPGNLVRLNADAEQWLHDTGAKIIHGVWNGITTGFTDVVNFFKNLPGWLVRQNVNADRWLYDTGGKIIRGIGHGISDAFQDVVHWFENLPQWIGSFFSNAGQWLYNAGKDVVNGLIGGIESMFSAVWHAVSNFAGGIVSGFKNALGINSPSKVMHDIVGTGIAEGIALGMDNHAHLVAASAASLSSSAVASAQRGLSNLGASSSLGVGGIGTGGAVLAGGATAPTTVINVNVAGSAVTEKELAYTMQTVMTRLGQRNSTTYRNYKR